MEIPFKYIVLSIVKTLNKRNMPLLINKNTLINYITDVVGNLCYTLEEKKEIGNTFDFQYELDDLLDKYFKYFENKDNDIIFDIDYIDELDDLINNEIDELDKEEVQYYDEAIEGNTKLLDILGIKINKKLYDFFIDIEKEIEECYDNLYALDSNIFDISNGREEICDKLKKLLMKKIIMIINSKNLLSEIEFSDVKDYSNGIIGEIIDEDDVKLLFESDGFNTSDIVLDVFLNSIFTNNDSYICNLNETFIVNSCDMDSNEKYNKIKFYMTFIDLLEREINNSYGFVKSELIKTKYRLMNVLDSVYGTTTFMGNFNNLNGKYVENYDFISEGIYFFIDELLMYDDEKYRNKKYNTDNVMIYVDNTIKKLLIETYYKLTSEEMVIKEIKDNKFYGINSISSGMLSDIIEKPKVKIKEV